MMQSLMSIQEALGRISSLEHIFFARNAEVGSKFSAQQRLLETALKREQCDAFAAA